jgi:hypothetical protein
MRASVRAFHEARKEGEGVGEPLLMLLPLPPRYEEGVEEEEDECVDSSASSSRTRRRADSFMSSSSRTFLRSWWISCSSCGGHACRCWLGGDVGGAEERL